MEVPSSPNTAPPLRRILLLTHPRTCSNLLTKILSLETQPNLLYSPGSGYFFMPATEAMEIQKLRGRPSSTWTRDEYALMKGLYQDCVSRMEAYTSAAEAQSKIAFVKEHAVTIMQPSAQPPNQVQQPESRWIARGTEKDYSAGNFTLLTDEFLKTWQAVILIRHPALVFSSQLRVMFDTKLINRNITSQPGEAERLKYVFTFHWLRIQYEFYAAASGPKPILLDADSIISSPSILIKFCTLTGLSPTHLRTTWPTATEEEISRFPTAQKVTAMRFLSTIMASSGIQTEKLAGSIDIDDEAKKWKEEFGEEDGTWLEGVVRDAMPDYEFLYERRLRA